MCVLVAKEPRLYREMLAPVLQHLRPKADIKLVDPEVLDRETGRLGPDLVICDEVSETVRAMALAWIMLYPDESSVAVISVPGSQKIVVNPDLACLVGAIDQTESLLGRSA